MAVCHFAAELPWNSASIQAIVGAEVDLSGSKAKVQFGLFKDSMKRFAGHLEEHPEDGQYFFLTELMVTPIPSGGLAVGGIQCYVLDSGGGDAFSFLLNSHHRLFVEAGLRTDAATAESLAGLTRNATDTVVEALRLQLNAGE